MHKILPALALINAASLLAGCASAPIEIAPDALITNRLGKPIKAILYRPCETNEKWVNLERTSIAAGTTIKITLPEQCVDLRAITDDGRVVGTQSSVRRQFPFRWQIY